MGATFSGTYDVLLAMGVLDSVLRGLYLEYTSKWAYGSKHKERSTTWSENSILTYLNR